MKHLLLIPILLCILLSCSEEEYPGVIKGNALLTNCYDCLPIDGFDDHSGIRVTLHSIGGLITETTTDNNGDFEINNIKPGEYKIRFEKEGFSFYEKFDIQIEDTDTVDLTQSPMHNKVIRLVQLEDLEYKILSDPYISSYKRGCISAITGEQTTCLRYDIVTEFEESRRFGCIAFISTQKDVDFENYEMLIGCSNMTRNGIPNRIFKFEFADLDRELFPLNTEIYIHFYPIDGGETVYDPWLNITKYFMIHLDKGQRVKFKIPGNSDYFEDIPL